MKQYSIMIIDDSEIDRYTLKRLLKSGGVNVPPEEAIDGEEALQFFKDAETNRAKLGEGFPPVVVFLDINMPRMDGFEFLDSFKKLREESEGYNAVVFLMVTSSDNIKDKEHADQYDFVKGYINKMPDTADELLSHISAYLPG
jgi:CheY-like chemotaxis protein